MIIFYIFTRDLIQKAVKLESSLVAVRRKEQSSDGQTIELFDQLVMDEAYEVLFKRLMLEAHSDIITNIPSNFLAATPTDLTPVWSEFPDFRQDRDFVLYMRMHNEWPLNYQKSVDVKIQQYLIDYILWKWFETKSPNDAAVYQSHLSTIMADIKTLLNKRDRPMRRLPSFP